MAFIYSLIFGISSTMNLVADNCTEPSITIAGPKPTCPGELIFEDNFTYDDPKRLHNNWLEEHRFASEPDVEFVMYNSNTSDVFALRNDALIIKPVTTVSVYGLILNSELDFGVRCTGAVGTDECLRQDSFDILPPVLSGQLSTRGKFSFMYGKVEIRAKLPSADWVFPQIFLNPVNKSYGTSDYQSGQMRVAFTLGTRTCDLIGGILLNAKEPFRTIKLCHRQCTNDNKWSESFHIYTLEWTDKFIKLAVDGSEYCDIRPGDRFDKLNVDGSKLPNAHYLRQSQSPMAPFDGQFYITLGYGVGGHNDFSDKDPSMWSISKPWVNHDPRAKRKFNKFIQNTPNWLSYESSFEIDYIRVYAI